MVWTIQRVERLLTRAGVHFLEVKREVTPEGKLWVIKVMDTVTGVTFVTTGYRAKDVLDAVAEQILG